MCRKTPYSLFIVHFIAIICLISCQSKKDNPEQIADLIITNGQFYLGDSTVVKDKAIAIKNGSILDIIEAKSLSTFKGPKTQIVDAKNNFVMPGLIEGHGHFLSFGQGLSEIDLTTIETWSQAAKLVEQKTKSINNNEWIIGNGWHQEKLSDSKLSMIEGYPTSHTIDAVAPNNPVLLHHASGHALLANKKAMELAQISKETKDPSGGKIIRDNQGNPTGVFEENAMGLIFTTYGSDLDKKPASYLETQRKLAMTSAAEICFKYGITSFQDAASTPAEISFLRKMAKAEELPIRLSLMAFGSPSELNKAMDSLKFINEADSFITCRAVKSFFDGALGSWGAWMLKPYTDKSETTGHNTTSLEDLNAFAKICKDKDLQFCVHAIGDRANQEVLNLMDRSITVHEDKRWRIEHAQHIAPEDIKRFAEIGVYASMQPIHCTSDAPYVIKRLGQKRAKNGAYMWRDLIDQKAQFVIGTDIPVESINPFENMYAAITRKANKSSEAFFPKQAMHRWEVLDAYTYKNAKGVFEEKFKGLLKPGYVADICILDMNLLTCDDDEIVDTKVLYTIVNGKIVYSKN